MDFKLSFCYVDDLISGMLKVMAGEISGPINLGNSEEITILELARKIVKKQTQIRELLLETSRK